MTPFDRPRLIADIGGTYARFALEFSAGQFEHATSLRCADHADFHAAVTAYLASVPAPRPDHAAVAIANPVEGDQVRMTNYHWQFSIEQMRDELALETLVVVNDFTALAMALPRLGRHDTRQVGGGEPRARSVIGLLGAGTGLGVSGLIPAGDGHVALGTEGGHVSFGPRDAREHAILAFAEREFDHVSFERLVSGPGLELIHRALRDRAGLPPDGLKAPEITRRGLDGSDALCRETLDAFCAMLGTAASNLAVTLGAMGGIFIGGGIVPRLGAYFEQSPFRARFEDKGRFSAYLAGIPTYVITAENATFIGASAILSEQLRGRHGHSGSTVLGQIQRTRGSLSPAEMRVADHVLAHPRSVLNDPIAKIARAASVSQPTVIRFCRSLGCEGLSDFKLRLASSLTGTIPVTHTQVTGEDTMLELGVKVLSNSAAAVLQLRDQLNRETIDRAIDLLTAAERVEFYAVGHYGVVADDAQFKFLRFGVASGAITDQRLQRMAASVLRPADVAVIISSSGKVDDLLAVADIARERGATVLAITASHSPLARRADVALIVDHVEDTATHVPMVSRILHLLVVDILAVGVAMRRGAQAVLPQETLGALDEVRPDTAPQPPRIARREAPGVSAAMPLSHLTSHSR
ncbi:MAG: glucokinase [Burkholderiaceae bacterium]|nr:glucokinase [Burkholderiaceae bacterium]